MDLDNPSFGDYFKYTKAVKRSDSMGSTLTRQPSLPSSDEKQKKTRTSDPLPQSTLSEDKPDVFHYCNENSSRTVESNRSHLRLDSLGHHGDESSMRNPVARSMRLPEGDSNTKAWTIRSHGKTTDDDIEETEMEIEMNKPQMYKDLEIETPHKVNDSQMAAEILTGKKRKIGTLKKAATQGAPREKNEAGASAAKTKKKKVQSVDDLKGVKAFIFDDSSKYIFGVLKDGLKDEVTASSLRKTINAYNIKDVDDDMLKKMMNILKEDLNDKKIMPLALRDLQTIILVKGDITFVDA